VARACGPAVLHRASARDENRLVETIEKSPPPPPPHPPPPPPPPPPPKGERVRCEYERTGRGLSERHQGGLWTGEEHPGASPRAALPAFCGSAMTSDNFTPAPRRARLLSSAAFRKAKISTAFVERNGRYARRNNSSKRWRARRSWYGFAGSAGWSNTALVPTDG